MKKYSYFSLFFIFLTFFSNLSYATENKQQPVLRIALLDNPHLPEKILMWHNYEKAYLAGVKTAVLAAKQQGLKIQYQSFFYGSQPLDILKQISKVKQWNPDLILGPHYSNQFLLLKKYFPDTLVLSTYASDPEISQLPDNFYSICPSDTVFVSEMLAPFIHQKFPNQNIDMIIQEDCKSCADTAMLLSKKERAFNKNIVITKTAFIGTDMKSIDLKPIIRHHKKGDIIFIELIDYALYVSLISRLTDILQDPKAVFLTVMDDWGEHQFVHSQYSVSFNAYRITPLYLEDSSDPEVQLFKSFYLKQHKKLPTDSVSYTSFLSVMSAVSALEHFPISDSPDLTMRARVLQSFRKALASDPNWFRPKVYGVYKYNHPKNKDDKIEVLVDTISVAKNNS